MAKTSSSRVKTTSKLFLPSPSAWLKPFSVPSFCRGKTLQSGRGGGGAGHVKFYPYEKGGGAKKSFSHAKGGTTSFGVVFTQ